MTRCLLLCASIAVLLAIPAAASAAPALLAPGTTGLTAPTGIARTPDGAVWVADEVRGICRVDGGELVESQWCGPGEHNEDETEEPEEPEAPVGADEAPVAPTPVENAPAGTVPASLSGLAFDPQTDNFYAGDRSSSGGGVWRLHYDRASGAIDSATEIIALADRVETVALGRHGELYFTIKRAGQILRIADPAGHPGALELVAVLGGGTEETEFEVAAMAATDDALYLGGTGVSRVSLTDANPTPQPVAGFEGRDIAALAVDSARGRLYVGDVDPQLGDIVEVVDVATGDHEPYEHGFATVTTLGVDANGSVVLADDPSLSSQFTAWQARIWEISLQSTGRPEATVTSAPPAATAATDARFAYASRAGASFECRLDGAAFEPCAGSGAGDHTYRGLAEGQHVFSVKATDGGLTGLPASVRFAVDRTAPKVVAIQPTTEYLAGISVPRIRFSANESGIAYTCSVDGGPFKRCFSGNPIDGLAPGVHVLRIVGTDAAGNASSPNDPDATVRMVVHARWAPTVELQTPAAAVPAAGAIAVAGETATSEHKPLLFPFTLRYKDSAGKTRVLRFGLGAPHGSAHVRVTVKDWRGRTVLTRVVSVRANARNSLAVTLTKAEQRRLRPGRYLVRAALRTARGLEGNAQTHWLRIRR